MRKKIIYLSIISSLIGANIISINLGLFQLSLFRALIMFIMLIMLIDILSTNRGIIIRNKRENNYSIIFMLVWVVYGLFSLGWVKDYSLWIKDIYFLCLGFLCIVSFDKYLINKSDILKAFWLMALMTIFHNLIGWYEIKTGNYWFLPLSRVSQYSRNNYPVSMFGNTNDFATFMLFSVFIVYVCIKNTKSFILKLIYIAIIISSVSLLIMTKSRANILGLILSVAVFIYFSMSKKKIRLILLIILSLGFITILLYPEMLKNLSYIINRKLYFKPSEQGGSDRTRINLIKNGFLFLLETFGFGTGAGNIEYWMDNYGVYSTGSIKNMHNWWMEILTGYGLFIFIMYLILYFKLFLSAYRRFKLSKDRADKSISLAIVCCMAGYVVGSISSSSNMSSEWLWIFWAIVISYQGIKSNNDCKIIEHSPDNKQRLERINKAFN